MTDVKPSSAYRLTFFHTFSTEPQVVSTSVQPRFDERLEQLDGDAERRQDDDVVRRQRVERFAGVAEEADALRANLVVDVRVVDDLAGQKDRAIGKALPRLIRVVHGAIDAVAEAELAREVHGEPAGLKREVGRLDGGDEIAVIALGEHAARLRA